MFLLVLLLLRESFINVQLIYGRGCFCRDDLSLSLDRFVCVNDDWCYYRRRSDVARVAACSSRIHPRPLKMLTQHTSHMTALTDEEKQLHPCPECTHCIPKWVLNCHGGTCMNCAIHGGNPTPCPGYLWGYECDCVLPSGYCEHCCKKLVPIGRARENGKQTHDDWTRRKYHKKCWKELMKDEN